MPVQVAVCYKDLQQKYIEAIEKNLNLNLGKRNFRNLEISVLF